MIVVDANLLLYAYHPRVTQHRQSRAWLEEVLSERDPVRFAWLTRWAFYRISTNSRVFEQPLSATEAETVISSWLGHPAAGILDPGERHWDILRGLVRGTSGRSPWSWTPSSPRSRSDTGQQSARPIAISRGFPD